MPELEADLVEQSATDDYSIALWRGLLEGLPEAAHELCERFGSKLLAFAAARFPDDRQLAEDVMVQSLTNAALNIRGFNPRKATFAAWLYGITRRQIRDELRKQNRLKSVPAAAQTAIEHAVEVSDGQDVAAAVAARVDAQRLVAELAAELSDIEFEVLVLNCIDKLSAKEIGLAVGRSGRAVHSLLHRARVKARGRLIPDAQRAS